MKKLATLLLVTFFAFNLSAKTVLLSDIDDTLKVAHVHSTLGKLRRAFQTDVKFIGMPELFSALKESGKIDKFFYLSNAPKKLMGRSHSKFLSKNKFPAGTVWLRDDLSSQEHKLFHLRKLAREESPDTVILFGDNGEFDASFYATFAQEFPQIKMITFIRYLYNEKEAVGQRDFVSALDPYLTLKGMGFINEGLKQEVIISKQILAAEREYSYGPVVFPSFLNCPGFKYTLSSSESDVVIEAVAKVEQICEEAPFYGKDEQEYSLITLSATDAFAW